MNKHHRKICIVLWPSGFEIEFSSLSNQKVDVITNVYVVLALVVQKVDNAIHRINHFPLDSAMTLSGG